MTPPQTLQYALDVVPTGRGMKGSRRASFLVAGSLIAAFGYAMPGLYEVTYQPPANLEIPATKLHGVVGGFNGWDGPWHGTEVLFSIVFLFLLGLLTPTLGFDTARSRLTKVQRGLHLAHFGSGTTAGLATAAYFLWQFRGGQVPAPITQAFLARAGGGPTAVQQSQYVFDTLGITAFILLIGLLVALIGVWPLGFGILNGLVAVFLAVTCAGASIGLNLPWAHAWQTIPTANGTRPYQAAACTIEPGHDENCESSNKKLVLEMPNPPGARTGCRFAIIIDWGDRSTRTTATVTVSKSGPMYTTTHTYRDIDAYVLTVTEKATAGKCTADPAIWKPQFTIGVPVGN